jgi:hypothetical protein
MHSLLGYVRPPGIIKFRFKHDRLGLKNFGSSTTAWGFNPGGRAGTEIFQYQAVEQLQLKELFSTRKLMTAYFKKHPGSPG